MSILGRTSGSGSSDIIVQTPGTSTTNVMSQKAVTDELKNTVTLNGVQNITNKTISGTTVTMTGNITTSANISAQYGTITGGTLVSTELAGGLLDQNNYLVASSATGALVRNTNVKASGTTLTVSGTVAGTTVTASGNMTATGTVTANTVTATNLNVNSKSLLNWVYPVGSIYMSVNSTNPGTLFGGTWTAWGQGRVPLGVGSAQANTVTTYGGDTTSTGMINRTAADERGGEATHKLTVSELATHKHYVTYKTNASTGGSAWFFDPGSSSGSTNGNGAQNAGEDQPHNNVQLYVTCYMWKRTA